MTVRFARERVAVMAGGAPPGREVVLETGRLLLRPWRVAEAAVLRELWTERDPRVPPHRRIDADGHPTVADLEESVRTEQRSLSIGLLAVERKAAGDVIGYCGLVDSGRGKQGEPELAFELLRRLWRRGYATEASSAVLDWAKTSGYERLWANRLGVEHRFSEGAGQDWIQRDRAEGSGPRLRDHPVHRETTLTHPMSAK
jgi:ribosomal-protein-alanine N-acetyltransferase